MNVGISEFIRNSADAWHGGINAISHMFIKMSVMNRDKPFQHHPVVFL
jgi:transposase